MINSSSNECIDIIMINSEIMINDWYKLWLILIENKDVMPLQ